MLSNARTVFKIQIGKKLFWKLKSILQDHTTRHNKDTERLSASRKRSCYLTTKCRMTCRQINRKTFRSDWLTLSGEFLSVEDASCWLCPFTFLFFLAPAPPPPPPPPPPPLSPPTLTGELFCWNSFSWAAHKKKRQKMCKMCKQLLTARKTKLHFILITSYKSCSRPL